MLSMKKNLSIFTVAIFAVFTLLCVTAGFGQTSTTGTVVGTIGDPNGAVVPNITVTLSGANLIRTQTATTDDNGTFRFSSVPPGRYTVEVAAASGFSA